MWSFGRLVGDAWLFPQCSYRRSQNLNLFAEHHPSSLEVSLHRGMRKSRPRTVALLSWHSPLLRTCKECCNSMGHGKDDLKGIILELHRASSYRPVHKVGALCLEV